MLAKLKKKRNGNYKSQPRATVEESSEGSESEPASQSSGHGAGGLPGTGAGIVRQAGANFPFP